jgi:hypothetical protein
MAENFNIPVTEHVEFIKRFCYEGFPLPEHLYHYTDSDGLNGLFFNKSIWLTSFKFMNDSRELVHGLDILGRKLQEFLIRDSYNPEFAKICNDLWSIILQDSQNPELKPYIFCLSEQKDDLSQWRGYGDFGRGFCVEFTASKMEHLGSQTILGKVQYDEHMYEALSAELVESWLNLCWFEAGKTQYSIPPNMMRLLASVFIQCTYVLTIKYKHKGFKAEQEWRLIKFLSRGSPEISFRPHRFGMADYFNLKVEANGLVQEVMSGPVGPKEDYLKSSLPQYVRCTKSPIPFV